MAYVRKYQGKYRILNRVAPKVGSVPTPLKDNSMYLRKWRRRLGVLSKQHFLRTIGVFRKMNKLFKSLRYRIDDQTMQRQKVDGMKQFILSITALLFFAEIASGAVLNKTDPDVMSKVNGIPLPFVKNKGQLNDPSTLFYSNTFAGRVSVYRDGSIGYRMEGNNADRGRQMVEIREKFDGTLKTAPSGVDKAIARVNHFQGKNFDKWVTDIPTFNTVRMREIYQGVSLILKARGNNVEKIFSVHPGADPKKIQLNIQGAKALRLTAKGELEVNTGAGMMRFSKPVAYQQISGRKTPVGVAYSVKGRSYGFKLDVYDQSKELIIDPLITGIFQGAADKASMVTCLAADGQDNIYAAGFSANQYAVFKFDKELKTLLSSALFSSASWHSDGYPVVYDIGVDHQDSLYLVGGTKDEDFPVTQGAFDTSFNVGRYPSESVDGFVIKFNADLNTILSSTFIGGDAEDLAYGIAIDRDHTVVVVGESSSPPGSDQSPFPTSPDAYDTTPGPDLKSKAFIIRLDNRLEKLLASTMLGNNQGNRHDHDSAHDVAIDAEGAIVVVGMTKSAYFPVTDNCIDRDFQGRSEAFISKFDRDLQNLLASTFLGGADDEKANVLAITANNEIVVAGWTKSSDFPIIKGSYDTRYSGAHEDGFVTTLSSDLTVIRASTFLGGNGHEQVSDMVIGDDDTVAVCGGTGSSDFPVTDDYQDNSFNGGMPDNYYQGDGFLTILNQTLTTLNASTYLGGRWEDHITSILLNNDDIIVAGETNSTDFPYITEKTGYSDAFTCRFNANEDPEPRPFTGKPGHWKSKDGGLANQIYLDVNICDNGNFRGIMKAYTCAVPGIRVCTLLDDAPSISVSGTIDFQNWAGTISTTEDCADVPFRISKQIVNEFFIYIDKDASAGGCFEGTRSLLYFKGENETGTCAVTPGGGGSGDKKDDTTESGGGGSGDKKDDTTESGGGGGGGCYLNSIF